MSNAAKMPATGSNMTRLLRPRGPLGGVRKPTGLPGWLIAGAMMAALLLVGLGWRSPVYADAPPVFDLGEMVVTGTRIPTLLSDSPGTVTVIDRKAIDSIRATDIGDVLNRAAGVDVIRNGSMGQVTMAQVRGCLAPQVLVMVDGRPINLPSLGSADLADITLDEVQQIEIVRGPASALYGGNALSGVINIITRLPDKGGARVELSQGGYNTGTYSGSFTTRTGTVVMRLLGGVRTTMGNRDNSNYLQNFTGFRVKGTSGALQWDVDWHGNYSTTGLPGAQPAENPAQRTATQLLLGNPEVSSLYDHQINRDSTLNANFQLAGFLLHAYRNEFMPTVYTNYIDFLNSRHRQDDNAHTDTLGADLQYRAEFGKGASIIAGGMTERSCFDYSSVDNDLAFLTSTTTSWSAARTTNAWYLQARVPMGDLTADLGLRSDQPSDFNQQLSPRVALLYRAGESTRFRAGYGEAFRPPSLNDLNWPLQPFAEGNPNLLPERSIAYELGVEHIFNDSLMGRLTWFSEQVRDMIAWAPTGTIGPFGNRWQPTNLNGMNKNGWEAELRWNPAPQWDLAARYSSLSAIQTNSELADYMTNAMVERQRRAINTPEHILAADLGYSFRGGVKVLLQFQAVGDKVQYYSEYGTWPDTSVTWQTKTLPAYTLLDATVSVPVKLGGSTASIFLRGSNLTDQRYSTRFGNDIDDRDFPMPGRSLTLGASVEM